jgi:hypothetical protein
MDESGRVPGRRLCTGRCLTVPHVPHAATRSSVERLGSRRDWPAGLQFQVNSGQFDATGEGVLQYLEQRCNKYVQLLRIYKAPNRTEKTPRDLIHDSGAMGAPGVGK